MSRSVDLSLELPSTSFVEGSTIDATVRATAGRDATVEGGRLELVRSTTYRYTTWSPYASPFTASARSSEVVSQAPVRPDGPLAAGRALVRPLTLAVPAEGPGSVQAELVEIGWAVHARLRVDNSREAEVIRPITVLSEARECAAVAHQPPVVEDHGAAALGSSRCRAAGWSLASRCRVP